jgi:hypothetical protein
MCVSGRIRPPKLSEQIHVPIFPSCGCLPESASTPPTLPGGKAFHYVDEHCVSISPREALRDGLVGRIVPKCIKRWAGRNLSVGATMKSEELVGSKVWVKSDQFKSVPGVISSVQTSVDHEDLRSSIAESTFKVSLSSGDVVEVPGTEFASIDHDGLRNQV